MFVILFFTMFPFDPPINIKNQRVSVMFSGDLKGTLGRKGLNSVLTLGLISKNYYKFESIVLCCAIWYHFYNLKNMKNTHGGVRLLVMFQSKTWNSTKSKVRPFFAVEILTQNLVCAYVCVSGGKKCSFFGKFGVLCFLEIPVLKFALLPYYRPIVNSRNLKTSRQIKSMENRS